MTIESPPENKPDDSQHAQSGDGFFANRQEHTITGALIGAVLDTFGSPQTDEARKQSAATHDEYAHLAADVIASIPQVKVLAAAGIRSAMLYDPSASASDNALSVGVNAAGGAALNKVMKFASAEGALGRAMARPSEAPLFQEGLGQYFAGAAFGLTRSTFDTRSWVDEKGDLSALSGVKNILISTSESAFLNVPAGMIGTRVAQRFGAGASDGILSRLMTGSASGASAGAVFGFVDGVIQTHSFAAGLTGMEQGMAVGALTGGAISAIPAGRLSPMSRQVSEATAPVSVSAEAQPTSIQPEHAEPKATVVSDPAVPLRLTAEPGFPLIGDGTFDGTRIQKLIEQHAPSLTFKSSPLKINDFDFSLPNPTKTTYSRLRLPTDAPPKFETEDQFYKALKLESTPALRFDLGGRSLIVPEDYLNALKPVRELRRGNPREAFKHDLGTNALPEEVAKALKRVPDVGRLGNVTLVNEPSISDLRRQSVVERRPDDLEGSRTAAFIDPKEGNLTLYAPKYFTLEETLNHEQVHRTQEGIKANDEQQRFSSSYAMEKEPPIDTYATARKIDDKLEASKYGYTQDVESEAELESMVFHNRSLETFFEGAERAPARMASIARRLAKTITSASPENRSLDQQEMLARCNYIERNVTPKVVDKLIDAIESGAQPDAVPLLARLVSEPNERANAILEKELSQGGKRMRLAAVGLARMDWRGNLPQLTEALKNASAMGERSAVLDAIIDSQANLNEKQQLALAIAQQPIDAAHLAALRIKDSWLDSPAALELLPKIPGMETAAPSAKLRHFLNEKPIEWNNEGTNGDAIQAQVDNQELAAELMQYYGTKSDQPLLHSIAQSEQSDRSQVSALGEKALKSLVALHSPDPHEQLNYLVGLTDRSSDVRSAALQVLSRLYSKHPGDWTKLPEAEPFRDIVSGITNHFMSADVVMRGLRNLPSPELRVHWFDDVVPQLEGRDYIGSRRSDLALGDLANGLLDIPELHDRAQALLGRIPEPQPGAPETIDLY